MTKALEAAAEAMLAEYGSTKNARTMRYLVPKARAAIRAFLENETTRRAIFDALPSGARITDVDDAIVEALLELTNLEEKR